MRVIAALFSMFMPGFGQFYNNQIFKGLLFVIFEHFDNHTGHINQAIHLDFMGHHQEAIAVTDYQNMLFYAPFYVYTVWDAMYHAKPGLDKAKSAIPFIIAAISGELASIYSSLFPFPTLTVGLIMIIPMLFGILVFGRK
ncbi:hypothetical protein DUZ99_15430 [Xylanibacillus composti]|uniref:Uncharacterized protein n=1 Tax=Xylanibacillus composti TaxID=1572762 RepID=A0A8J4M3S4_9BACL|nr:hypothetical protein [Xylanibacillus composti]MDT9726374.1 hypothetical protein [Xylanibacillus composti]GIQ70387.1 hypothetical protein XYCOK13_32110 [Xylanibacillus composti]